MNLEFQVESHPPIALIKVIVSTLSNARMALPNHIKWGQRGTADKLSNRQ